MIRFIHAADIHLDSPLLGLGRYEGAPVAEIRGAARRALENLVQLAIDEAVHFVVIAGDVFDGDWPDVSTGLFFVKQMARLRDRGTKVYVISGNHDAANKITRRLPYPENVHLFRPDSPETERLENIHVAIHGQSYAEQSEMRNLATNYPDPVAGYFNIGLLHTSLDGREGHERYAPCQVDELVARGYDYWALGHVHQRESVNGDRRPLVEFPGNIQGRHARETGAKGCLLVQVANDNSTTVTFRALDVLRWEQVIVDCSGLDEVEAVVARVTAACDKVADEREGRVVAARIALRGECNAHDLILAADERVRNELCAYVVGRGDDAIWIEKIDVRTSRPKDEIAKPGLTDDAISELAAVIKELSSDEGKLKADAEIEDLKHLNGRLPPELKHCEDATLLTDPKWITGLLDRAQAILTDAATAKESVPS